MYLLYPIIIVSEQVIRKKFLRNKKAMLFPACLVTELMIIPIPTSLPRSSINQYTRLYMHGYLIESERARGSDVGIGIIISSVTKQAGNNVNPPWPFYFKEFFLHYHKK